MCRAVTCRTCGKTTWAGCGRHVEQVMGPVPAAQRCEGHERAATARTTTRPGSLAARLFGRRPGNGTGA